MSNSKPVHVDFTDCDVCDGTGTELDAGGWPVDCHLCEGTGRFGPDGFPLDDEELAG